jgi:iron complex outermembrane receptor protein
MMQRRFCAPPLFYAMMGLAGIAVPFAAHAQQTPIVPSTTLGAPAKEDAEKATGTEGGSTQTKVVVGRKQIEESSQQDGASDAVKGVPGAASNNGAGSANDSLKFRGIQLGLYTNYRLNGGLAIANVITIPTEDKERVEALKGANALMFGLASPAGIINLVTKRPIARDLATLTVSGNAFGQYGAAVDLNHTFGSEHKVGVRLNASDTHVATGVDHLSGTGRFGSAAIDWYLTRDLVLRLDYESYMKDVLEQGTVAPLAAVNGKIVVPRTLDPRKMLGATWGGYTPHTHNKIVRLDYRISDQWRALAEVGASNSERSRVQARTTGKYDVDTGAGTLQIQWIKNQHYDNSFARAELVGRFALAGIANDAAFGASESIRRANNPFGFASVNTPINIYDPAPIPYFQRPDKPENYAPSRNQEKSLYVYDTVSLTSTLKVLAGVRKSAAEFTNTNQKTFARSTLESRPTAPGAGIMWEVAPRTTVYGSFMRAVEDGPTATAGSVNEFQILAPTQSTQKEVGLRTAFFGPVFANIDYFDIERANAVTNKVAGPQYNEFLYDGTSHLRGFEIAANARFSSEWSASASAQLMRATQQTLIDPALNGKTPENTANVMGTFTLAYNPAWMRKLTLRAGASYTGPRFINALDQGQIPGVSLFNAAASYQTAFFGHKTNLQVAVSNLADKWYWNSVTSSAFGAGMQRALRFSAKIAY